MVFLHQYQLSDGDADEPLAKKHSAHGAYEGCVTTRRTTDIIFLFLLFFMWLAMTVIGSSSVRNGDPYRLIAPINDIGQVCGHDTAVLDQSRFYSVISTGAGVCTNSCPTVSANLTSLDTNDYYCLESITSAAVNDLALSLYIRNYCHENGEFDITSDCGCMLKFASTSVFLRCTIDDEFYRNQIKTQLAKGYLTNFIGDVLQAREIIFGYGVGMSIFLSFVWVTLLRFECLSHLFIWGSILGAQILFIVMTIVAYLTANKWEDENPMTHNTQEIRGIRCLSAICLGLAVIWLIMSCVWRSAINLAVKTMALTAECIEDMPLIVITPLVQAIGVVCFVIPWAFYCFFIASNGKFTTEVYASAGPYDLTYLSYNLGIQNEGRLWFLFFCFLWTVEFIKAMGCLIISIAVSKWYFSKPDDRTVLKGSRYLTVAYGCALRFHAGTAAFGSLIIAIIEFLRYVVLYIEHQTKGLENNIFMKYVFGCIHCCLWCLEKCLRFIAKNAYYQTAIHGSSFCIGAKDAFFLMCRNVFRIGALQVVSGIALFIGKIFVVVTVGATTYFIFTGSYGKDLEGYAAPTILTMVVAYAIVSMFTEVFETAVGCMLQCYITDEEFHDGAPIYATSSMKAFIEKHGAVSKDEFEKENPRASSRQVAGDTFKAVPMEAGAGAEMTQV